MIILYWINFTPSKYTIIINLDIFCDKEKAMICDTFFDTLINSFLKGLTSGSGIAEILSGN